MGNHDSNDKTMISRIIDMSKGILIEEDTKIIEVNQRMLDLLHINNESSLVNEPLFKIFPVELRGELRTILQFPQNHLDCIQTTIITDTLEKKPVLIEIKHLNIDNKIQRVFIFEDITRFTYKTREIINTETRPSHDNDLYLDESIKQFTKAVTHEINNKLTPIILSSEILTDQLTNKYQQHLAKTINQSSHQISSKLLRLKAFSDEIILHRELYNISDLIPMISDNFETEIEWIIADNLPLIHVDVTSMHVVNWKIHSYQ